MTNNQKNIQEVLENLMHVTNEDNWDWDMAGIVYELEKHIDDALKLSEVKVNPETKNLLKSVKESISLIDFLLDDYGEDSSFQLLEARNVFNKKKFKDDVSLAIKSLVSIAKVKKNYIFDEDKDDLR